MFTGAELAHTKIDGDGGHVLRPFLDNGVVGLLLVLAADLLPPIVDDQEPRRRATLRQAAKFLNVRFFYHSKINAKNK